METLHIAIPKWNITEFCGYKPLTTFWQDFSIADKFGNNAIEDTFKRAKAEWKEPKQSGKTTTSFGRSCALSSTTRFGSGMRGTTGKHFSMTVYGEKRME